MLFFLTYGNKIPYNGGMERETKQTKMERADEMKKSVWTKQGEIGGSEIFETEKGWIIESWSRFTGCMTGEKHFIYYSTNFPKGLDLSAEWNTCFSNGEILSTMVPDKVLKKGVKVQ